MHQQPLEHRRFRGTRLWDVQYVCFNLARVPATDNLIDILTKVSGSDVMLRHHVDIYEIEEHATNALELN